MGWNETLSSPFFARLLYAVGGFVQLMPCNAKYARTMWSFLGLYYDVNSITADKFMINGTTEKDLSEARKLAGGLLQAFLIYPSFFLLALGMAGPNFEISDLLTNFFNSDDAFFKIAWVGVPIAGLLFGHLIKRGIRWAYFLGLLIGTIALFLVPPLSTIFGVALLYQILKVFRLESALIA